MSAVDQSDRAELERIARFKQGFNDFLDQQTAHSAACQQLLMSQVISREERQKLQAYSAAIDKDLGEIGSHVRKLKSNLSPAHLEKEAAREYHAFFDAEPSENGRKFLEFFKTFEYLFEFWRETSSIWIEVNDRLREAELPAGTDFQKQFIQYRMTPSMEDLEGLETFLGRMARILFGNDAPVNRQGKTRNLRDRAVYQPDIEYRFSAVFIDNLEEKLQSLGYATDLDDVHGLDESTVLPGTSGRPAPAPRPPADPRESPRLNAAGSHPWNSNPFYYLAYDPFLLNRERQAYAEVVHIDTHMGADQETLRGDIIRNFSRRGQAIATDQIEAEYTAFLHTYFDLVVDISLLNVGVSPADRLVFLFHLGPQTFFHLTRRFLQEAKTGTFHRRKTGGKVVTKYLPAELMKKILIVWWHDQVLAKIGDEKDDYAKLKQLARQIKRNFERILEEAKSERKELAGKSSAEILASDHINQIFGGPALIVVRRFLRV